MNVMIFAIQMCCFLEIYGDFGLYPTAGLFVPFAMKEMCKHRTFSP